MSADNSAAIGCIVNTVTIAMKLAIVLFVLLFVYFIFVNMGIGVAPDWMMKGYTNEHYRAAEKYGKSSDYEKAAEEFLKAIETEPENKAMVQDSRFHIAECYEKIAGDLEPEIMAGSREAIRKQSKAYDKAIEQYKAILADKPKNKEAQKR